MKYILRIPFAALLSLTVAALLLFSDAAHADTIHLKNGRVLEGRVIREDGDMVTIEVGFGQLRLHRDQIDYIERESPESYYSRTGDHMLRQGRFAAAERCYREGLRHARGSERLRLRLGRARMAQARALARDGKPAAAREKARQAEHWLDEEGVAAAKRFARRMQEEMTRAGQLAQLGRELAAVHRFEAALDKLHAALAINNELIGELGRALGTAHRDEGDHAMRRQGYAAAATAYEKALRYAPSLADEIERPYVIARLHLLSDVLKAHRWEAAKEEIDDLLTFAPTSPPVRLCAGDVAAQTGKLQRAAKHYATGLDTRPPHRASREDVIALRERLLERVKSPPAEPAPARTTRTAQTLETAHFVVQHHNSEIGRQVAETAEFHFARITELLDVAPEDLWQEPCKIVVHATQDDYTRATGQAGWSGGVSKIESYAGRLKKQQIASWQTSPELLKSVLPHEITHLVMAAALKYDTKVPLALHEGVAVLMEPQFRGQYYDQMLNLRLGKAGLPPLSELFTHGQYPGDHELFYAQSASLVGYLADEGGLGNLVGFYRSVARDGLRPSLQRHYGVESLDDLEKRWLEALREEKP